MKFPIPGAMFGDVPVAGTCRTKSGGIGGILDRCRKFRGDNAILCPFCISVVGCSRILVVGEGKLRTAGTTREICS